MINRLLWKITDLLHVPWSPYGSRIVFLRWQDQLHLLLGILSKADQVSRSFSLGISGSSHEVVLCCNWINVQTVRALLNTENVFYQIHGNQNKNTNLGSVWLIRIGIIPIFYHSVFFLWFTQRRTDVWSVENFNSRVSQIQLPWKLEFQRRLVLSLQPRACRFW